ncbi:MAG: three-Cys-motif partner protein TcmP [Conexivisphaerales archaeon]
MNRENNGLLILKEEDGFPCLTEGVQDYTLIRYKIYKVIFSTWTSWWKDRTSWLGYLDLTSGPGYSQTEELKKLKKQAGASPIIAIEATPPFTHFIFIEKDPDFCDALRKRILGKVNCIIRPGNANDLVDSALLEVKGHCLACVDPFRPSDITWRTVSKLLQEKFCDVVGVLPAPLIQRPVGRFIKRDYIRSLYNHMPPSFNLKDAEKYPKGKLAYCRHFYINHIENKFKRSVFTYYIKDAKYQVLFATTEHGLKEKIKNQVKSLVLGEGRFS